MITPFVALFAAEQFVPALPVPAARDFAVFLQSGTGQAFFHGSWGWFALVLVMGLFNTVLGEELFFRGFLLPRMNGAFGRADWVANGFLFAMYHLHVPWVIPTALIDTFSLALPAKRYRSAWMSIAVHSTQTVFISLAVLTRGALIEPARPRGQQGTGRARRSHWTTPIASTGSASLVN